MISLRRMAAAIVLSAALLQSATAADIPPASSAEITLRVTCLADGETPDDGSLTFVLWDEQYQILQQVVNLGGHASFAPLSFSSAGRYTYYITQDAGEDLAVVYDSAAYQIVIAVAEEEGQLDAQVLEVNRVSGDPAGCVQILEILDAGAIPAFENGVRQWLDLPPVAEVPKTGDETVPWLLLSLLSGLCLLQIRRRKIC